MKEPWMQTVFGMFLGVSAFIGIAQQSWESFFNFFGVAAFFLGGLLASHAVKSQRRPVMILGAVGCAAFLAVIIGVILSAGERALLVNSSSYPTFLATDIGQVNSAQLELIRKEKCENQMMEIYEKTDFWLIRCGFSYFDGHTFISHGPHPFADESEGATK